MKLHTLTMIVVLVSGFVAERCHAAAQFGLTDAEMDVTGFSSDPSGFFRWTLTGVDDQGSVLQLSEGAGYSGAFNGNVSLELLSPFVDGVNFEILTNLNVSATLDGVAIDGVELQGSWTILSPDISSPISPEQDPVTFDYVRKSGSVEDVPVTFAVDFDVFLPGETDPTYSISGSGDGTAEAFFSTWSPSDSSILQTGADYDLNVTSGNAVPEPSSLVVWGVLLTGLLAVKRRQR